MNESSEGNGSMRKTASLGSPSCTRQIENEEVPSATRRSQGWYSRGYLPHFDAAGLVQHLTFHLADSLPWTAIERMQAQIASLPVEHQSVERRKRIQDLLDSGLGTCILRHDDCARVVEDSLVFGDGTRYRLLCWSIMPNHVHVLIQQMAEWPLAKVVQSWKRHTSRELHRIGGMCHLGGLPNPLWQRDYWDRFIRDERHFNVAKSYVEDNPVKAGLVTAPELWGWGSARFVLPSATRRSQGRSQGGNVLN